jgi:hypothetical protein
MTNNTTYWGIKCRTCRELVAFDASPYLSFGSEAASIRPGAIRCRQGHVHIYFPNDFHFLLSEVPIPDAVMEKNREVYRSVNPTRPGFPEPPNPKKHVESESEVPKAAPEDGNVHRATRGPDARRETAQAAAKHRWTDWATKKAM